MGSLIFVVEDKIQNMELRFILLFAFLFAAVSALPGKKEKNMKWDDTSDEMEEDEIFQMDDAVNTVDDEPQENVEEMEGTAAVQGKYYGYGGYGGYGLGGYGHGRRKREAGKKGKGGIPYTGDENAEAEDDEPQAEGEEMEGTVSVEGKYGRWGGYRGKRDAGKGKYGRGGYYARRKRGAGKRGKGKEGGYDDYDEDEYDY